MKISAMSTRRGSDTRRYQNGSSRASLWPSSSARRSGWRSSSQSTWRLVSAINPGSRTFRKTTNPVFAYSRLMSSAERFTVLPSSLHASLQHPLDEPLLEDEEEEQRRHDRHEPGGVHPA